MADDWSGKLDDIIGRTDLIIRRPDDGIKKHQLINFDKVLARVDNGAAIRHIINQQHGIDRVKDVEMLNAAANAVDEQKEVSLEYTIANTDRACGAMLSGAIAAKYGAKRPARTYTERQVQRLGRTEFRSIPRTGYQLQAGR
mgnify:FL=1